jgi:hypothetical protein
MHYNMCNNASSFLGERILDEESGKGHDCLPESDLAPIEGKTSKGGTRRHFVPDPSWISWYSGGFEETTKNPLLL